ncbi:MAG: NADH-quinone oxidoreductase subunit NuoK [Deltaproteobacteria bacterium]|nr:NADH-quinone oxidoreductase subunit NuoK [Deltaproteobacteria bacterium]
MSATPLSWYLLLSFAIFSIGLLGLLIRRNLVVMLMAMELMLNGANLALVAYARFRGDEAGQVMAFFVMALAAAEAAIGLALVLAIYKHFKTLDVDRISRLNG